MLLRGNSINIRIIRLLQNRPFTASCNCKLKDYTLREAKFMKKLLYAKPSKKKYFGEDRGKTVQSVLDDPASRRTTPIRVSVLNKLLMTNITDILATGEISIHFVGRGFEITNVSVNKDYQFVKVYWCAKSKEDENFLQEKLPNLSYNLRHELSQLHVMGSVPRVQFFLDQTRSRLALIDSLLTNCDKGVDVVENDFTESEDDVIPEMTHNIYGLQHDAILAKIVKLMNKAKAPHRNKNCINESDSSASNFNKNKEPLVDLSSKYTQKESIRKFLLQRRLDREKIKKNSLVREDESYEDGSSRDFDREEFSSLLYQSR